jgi:transcriptional regulator with XRE-family HTH domain
MEMKINSDRVKQLRKQRSWSQDQLASVSGLSLRTIQRIENMGVCSLDSKRALAAVFEVAVETLAFTESDSVFTQQSQRGFYYGCIGGYIGTGLGIVSALTAILWSLINGYMSFEAAGIYLGTVGALGGICCAAIGVSYKYFSCCKTDG